MLDRRNHPRVAAAFAVTLKLPATEEILQGRSVDLSKSGIFVHLAHSLPEGQAVEVWIDSLTRDTPIVVPGTVVHSVRRFGVGVRFAELMPEVDMQVTALLAQLSPEAGATPASGSKEDLEQIQKS